MATAEASPPTPTRSGIHVVVLDESPALAAAFASEFARAGYRVSVLTDCDQVEPTDLVRLRPDLIVLDVACGFGHRGMGLLRGLRACPAGRNVPVIASPTITLYDRQARAAELRALGAVVLPDPFTVDDLLAAAGAAVEQSREMRRRSDALIARLHRALKQPSRSSED
jgi:DNA-binding response OmpR family regulator